jgi:hypothetical protein
MVRRSRRASGRRTRRHSRHLMKSRRVRRMRHTRTRGRRGGAPPSSNERKYGDGVPNYPKSNSLTNVADQYHPGPYPGGEV